MTEHRKMNTQTQIKNWFVDWFVYYLIEFNWRKIVVGVECEEFSVLFVWLISILHNKNHAN